MALLQINGKNNGRHIFVFIFKSDCLNFIFTVFLFYIYCKDIIEKGTLRCVAGS